MSTKWLCTLIAVVGLGFGPAANAAKGDSYFLGSYSSQKLDFELVGLGGFDVSPTGLDFAYGHYFHKNFAVEFRTGFALSEDDFFGSEFEINSHSGVYGKLVLDMNEMFQPYAAIGYNRIKVKASFGGVSDSSSDSDLAYALGADILFNPKWGMNVEWNKMHAGEWEEGLNIDLTAIKLGIRYTW